MIKKIKKVSFFQRILKKFFGTKKKEDFDETDEDSEEEEVPLFIESKGISCCAKFYDSDYSMREIKKIYKRIINPKDP